MWEGACPRWRPLGRPGCWIRSSTYPFLRSRPLRVPLLQRLTFEKRKSKQNALAPPLGTSPRLGVPSLRPAWFNGAPEIKIKSRSRSRAARFASWLRLSATGLCRYPCPDEGGSVDNSITDPPPSGASPLPHLPPRVSVKYSRFAPSGEHQSVTPVGYISSCTGSRDERVQKRDIFS